MPRSCTPCAEPDPAQVENPVPGPKDVPSAGPHIRSIFSHRPAELIYAEQYVPSTGDAVHIYWSSCNFYFGRRGGYAGIQHKNGQALNPQGKPMVYNNIFSVWDLKEDENRAHPPEVKLEYACPGLFSKKFGGEGTGLHTSHPMPWKLDTWYATVVRRWYRPGEAVTHAAMFMFSYATKTWTHYASVEVPQEDMAFTNSTVCGFLERFWGTALGYHGFYGHHYRMLKDGSWERPERYVASACGSPSTWDAEAVATGVVKLIAGGRFDNDATEKCFRFEREQERPKPSTLAPNVTNVRVRATRLPSLPHLVSLDVEWNVAETGSPQLTYCVRVLGQDQSLICEKTDFGPDCRKCHFNLPYKTTGTQGSVEIRITSIFNDDSEPRRKLWKILKQAPREHNKVDKKKGGKGILKKLRKYLSTVVTWRKQVPCPKENSGCDNETEQ